MGGEAGHAVRAEGVGRGWSRVGSCCCCSDDAGVFEGYVEEVDGLVCRENIVHDAG